MNHPIEQKIENIVTPEYLSQLKADPDRKIKVLLIITRLTIGGDTNVILDIATYLKNLPQFEAHLVVGPVPDTEIDLTDLAFQREIPTTVLNGLSNRLNPFLYLIALTRLIKMMVREKYDIVHTHSSVAGILGRSAAYLSRIPVIVHHVHGWGLQADMSWRRKQVYLTAERLCSKFTDRLIAVSKPNISKGVEYRIAPLRKFVLIYNGIHLEQFRQKVDKAQVCKQLGLNPEYKIVGMIGRLDKQKNPLDFIRAAARVVSEFPKVQFIIAGDGSLRPECEELIQTLNLQRHFFLLGFRNDIDRILPVLSLTALSSLWEGLPVVFQESLSAGIPIVANDVDGARDVVIDGKTGYLVRPHHPQEMAERIIQLLKNDQLRLDMGATAQKYSERFSEREMLINLESLYKELLAS